MTVYGHILPGAATIARWAARIDLLTETARRRLKVLDWHRAYGGNESLTARHFGIARTTLRRWLERLARLGPVGLNEQSRRPRHTRAPVTPWEVVMAVSRLRRQYPAWSKHKLQVLLRAEGVHTSVSTVGRVLRRRGFINPKVSRKRQKAALTPKRRFPRDLVIKQPGDLIQMDTKHLVGIGGIKLYQFTAIDVLSKVRVLGAASSPSSRQARVFLEECLRSFQFPIRAVQTDNGPEFLGEFRKACRANGIPRYFIEVRQPKQNTYVERSHGADKREFYQQGNMRSTLKELLPRLKEWERIYNTVRPHQSLNYLTPYAFLERFNQGRLPTTSFIALQT